MINVPWWFECHFKGVSQSGMRRTQEFETNNLEQIWSDAASLGDSAGFNMHGHSVWWFVGSFELETHGFLHVFISTSRGSLLKKESSAGFHSGIQPRISPGGFVVGSYIYLIPNGNAQQDARRGVVVEVFSFSAELNGKWSVNDLQMGQWLSLANSQITRGARNVL